MRLTHLRYGTASPCLALQADVGALGEGAEDGAVLDGRPILHGHDDLVGLAEDVQPGELEVLARVLEPAVGVLVCDLAVVSGLVLQPQGRELDSHEVTLGVVDVVSPTLPWSFWFRQAAVMAIDVNTLLCIQVELGLMAPEVAEIIVVLVGNFLPKMIWLSEPLDAASKNIWIIETHSPPAGKTGTIMR